jgi:hypothetical protein
LLGRSRVVVSGVSVTPPASRADVGWTEGARLNAWLAASGWVTGPGIAACLALPPLFGFGNASYLASAAVTGLVALAFSRLEAPEERRTFRALWMLSLFVTLVALLAMSGAWRSVGGPSLGPDSTLYLRRSLILAGEHLNLGDDPTQVFVGNEFGHCYAYAALIRLFGADVFAIQVFNCGLLALAGALTYAAARFVIPRHAVAAGALVALDPELAMLAARDLLKDPSIVLGLTASVRALVGVWRATTRSERLTWGAVGAATIGYLRIDRFYVAVYLAVAVAGIALLVALRRRPEIAARRRVAVAVLAVFATAEIAIVALGWPSAVTLTYAQITHVRHTPVMSDYSIGVADRLTGPLAPAASAIVAAFAAPRASEELGRGLGLPAWSVSVANALRRMYGPFVWIVPSRWDLREILTADYVLYPGMLVWYAVLPVACAGVGWTLWRTLVGREENVALMVLCAFTVLYFAQYLMLNFSYRQRAAAFPVLAVFAFVGLSAVARIRSWKRWYAGYWGLLGLVAAGHLALRGLGH